MSYMVISDVYRSFIPNKTASTKYCLTQIDFIAPQALPGKFQQSGGQTQCNSLLDWANFYRSLAWQIFLIFNTEIGMKILPPVAPFTNMV